jgi:hypothetical protein
MEDGLLFTAQMKGLKDGLNGLLSATSTKLLQTGILLLPVFAIRNMTQAVIKDFPSNCFKNFTDDYPG